MDDQFLTGHEAIDQQHRTLFGIIDHVRAQQNQGFADDIDITLDLIKYVIQHFDFEKRLMVESAYPGATEHLEKHRQISEAVSAYSNRIMRGEPARLELGMFIDVWIRHHIGEEDRNLVKYLVGGNEIEPVLQV